MAERVAHLSDQLGSQNRLARILGVSQAQPSTWRRGHEQPSPEMAHRLLALDYVVSRLADELTDWQIEQWLTSANAHLGGARPVDVIRDSGPLAIDAAVTAVVTGASV